MAQVRVEVALPNIIFPAPPQLVVVSPGVQVVPDYEDEVFFVDGYYWHRRGPNWYRTSSFNGGWVVVGPRFVPPAIVALPPGQYRKWHREERNEEREHEKHEDEHEKHEEKREKNESKGKSHKH